MTQPNQPDSLRERVLKELDPDFKTYTPDQGMPDTVWELNDAQIDYIITQAHQAGIDEAVEIIKDYEARMSENHKRLIGNSHEDSKMMLVFDMHSRLIATNHLIKALQDKK